MGLLLAGSAFKMNQRGHVLSMSVCVLPAPVHVLLDANLLE